MDDGPPETPRPKRPKFKHTRELIRIAVQDGMTQKQIADLCRVEQSVVSGWFNGRSAAYEHQVAELRRRYGGRLNRTTSRVYLVREEAPQTGPWEETERGRALFELKRILEDVELRITGARGIPGLDADQLEDETDFSCPDRERPNKTASSAGAVDAAADAPRTDPRVEALEAERSAVAARVEEALRQEPASLRKDVFGEASLTERLRRLIVHERDAHALTRHPERVTVVEGPLVFRYTFVEYRARPRGKDTVPTPVPVARWCVHQLSRDRLLLVQQRRRVLTGLAKERWRELRWPWERDDKGGHWRAVLGERDTFEVESPDDAARWVATLRGPMDAEALVAFCDAYLRDAEAVHDPRDEAALPFLLRKALVEHGHALEGVVRIVASE